MNTTLDSIRLNCSGCGTKARVPAKYAGRRVRCTNCQQSLRVPGGLPEAREEPQFQAQARATTARRPRARRVDSNPYAPPSAKVESRPSRETRGRDLAAEGHIQAIAVWGLIQASLVGLAGLVMFGLGAASGQPVALVGAVVLAIGAFFIWQGLALKRYQNWARWVTGVILGLGMLGGVASVVMTSDVIGNVIGLSWQAANLWALFGLRANRVFSPSSRSDGRGVAWWASPFFYLPFVLLGLGLLLVLVAIGVR